MDTITIGEVARRAGVNVETIRFYEREGLIAQPPRGRSGYRQYPADAVRRIQFIRQAKVLGFTLQEIADLLSLRVVPGSSCDAVRATATAKIADIDERISELERIRTALKELTEACIDRGPTGECPILEALDRAGAAK
jgi:MerR family mercuric resistance operon transcriptional regulator